MFIRFATLGLIVAAALSSVSAARSNVASADVTSNPSGAKSALPVMRTSLNRRKVASLLERRRHDCDHHNHRNYHHGDDMKFHYNPRHHFCPEEFGPYCGEPDEYEEYDHYDYDDDEYYECDECDECEDHGFHHYMSWEDYEDERT